MPDLSLDESSIQIPPDLPPLDGKLSRAARVLLAMDVRTRLTAETPDVKLLMRSTYFDCAKNEKIESGPFDSSKIPTGVCQVCARGALFLASVDRYNECKISGLHRDRWADNSFAIGDKVYKRSAEDFGGEQVNAIECAFENDLYKVSAKTKMLAICENMIANHGEMIPEEQQSFIDAVKASAKAKSAEVLQ